MDHRRNRAISHRLLQHLIIPQRFIIGVQKNMRVDVAQSGKQSRTWQLKGPRVSRSAHLSARSNGDDFLAGDQHLPPFVNIAIHRVEHSRWREQQRSARFHATFSSLGRLCAPCVQHCHQEKVGQHKHSKFPTGHLSKACRSQKLCQALEPSCFWSLDRVRTRQPVGISVAAGHWMEREGMGTTGTHPSRRVMKFVEY